MSSQAPVFDENPLKRHFHGNLSVRKCEPHIPISTRTKVECPPHVEVYIRAATYHARLIDLKNKQNPQKVDTWYDDNLLILHIIILLFYMHAFHIIITALVTDWIIIIIIIIIKIIIIEIE